MTGFRLPPAGAAGVSRQLREIQSNQRPGIGDVAVVLWAIAEVIGCRTDKATALWHAGTYLTVDILDDDYDGVPDFDALSARLLLDLAASTGRVVALGAPVVSEGAGIIGIELRANRAGGLILSMAVL
jgi:hypothetical protein